MENGMVQENEVAPDFELSADDGSTVRLSALRGKRVILFFYPRASTPGCTMEACEFRDLHPVVQERDAVVLGISPDPVADLVRFRDDHGLPFRLLSDADHQVAEVYGVWKEKSMYGRTYMGVERTTFVIDADGRIEKAYRKVTPKGHAQEVLEGL
jgi:thioredoxin-dependent peroxiredoxin